MWIQIKKYCTKDINVLEEDKTDVFTEAVDLILGKAKKKRIAKLKKRRLERIRKGIYVPFTIANCSKPLKGICKSYQYKVNVHHCSFNKARFCNVRYRSGHITQSSFKEARLTNVDFISVNLKNNKFRHTHFKKCLFFGCNFENSDFKNAGFSNTYFINCKLKNVKNLRLSDGLHIINHYPDLKLSDELEGVLHQMSEVTKLEKYKILTINKKKNNYWMLNLLLEKYTEIDLINFFNKLINNNKTQFYTIQDYISALTNYYKR